MCRVYPQVVRTTFNNRHTSKVNSQTTSDVIQLLVNRLLRHFTNRPLYMYAYIYHVSMFMFVGDTGATHNCFRHVHAKYTDYGQLCQFHVNLVRQPSPLFCSSLFSLQNIVVQIPHLTHSEVVEVSPLGKLGYSRFSKWPPIATVEITFSLSALEICIIFFLFRS